MEPATPALSRIEALILLRLRGAGKPLRRGELALRMSRATAFDRQRAVASLVDRGLARVFEPINPSQPGPVAHMIELTPAGQEAAATLEATGRLYQQAQDAAGA